jgi:hypothetical protein
MRETEQDFIDVAADISIEQNIPLHWKVGFLSLVCASMVLLHGIFMRRRGLVNGEGILFALCLLFLLSNILWTFISVLRRRWMASITYFLAMLLAPASLYISALVNDDRFAISYRSHDEISTIHGRNASQFTTNDPDGRLFSLGDACHPPPSCQCWILADHRHGSGVDRDIGKWHEPKASIFVNSSFEMPFTIVDVRRLNNGVYSILSCQMNHLKLL